MITFDFFGHLSPNVQLAAIIGLFALLLLVACSRSAGRNLLLFLRGALSLFRQQKRRGRKNVKKHHESIPHPWYHLDEEQLSRQMLIQQKQERPLKQLYSDGE
jgi:hypothetical protein